jgi:hypothetical protein
MVDPIPERPYIAHREYGIPDDTEGLLAWSDVRRRLASARNYWICTSSGEGRPHGRPTWGVVWGNSICFGGGPRTRWSQNVEANPWVSVHLESGQDVVIAEGPVERITEAADSRLVEIDDLYEEKYEMRHGPPIWILEPVRVLAWTEFPKDMTRFRFP